MDQLQLFKQFANTYNIRDVNRTMEARSIFRSFDKWSMEPYENLTSEVHHIPVLTLKIDEKTLESIAGKVLEIDELLSDPECARLLMEARFIHRLKRGFR